MLLIISGYGDSHPVVLLDIVPVHCNKMESKKNYIKNIFLEVMSSRFQTLVLSNFMTTVRVCHVITRYMSGRRTICPTVLVSVSMKSRIRLSIINKNT